MARTIEAETGETFAELVARVLPQDNKVAWSLSDGDTPPVYPQLTRLGPSLPLSTGDGGLWTSALAYRDFLDAQNRDELGISQSTQSDYALHSGKEVAYGWGVGIRSFRGRPLYMHGGGWTGCRARAVRCPDLELSAVVLTASDADEMVVDLTDRLCELVIG